jgi:hypothetical protein
MTWGRLETPSLAELREQVSAAARKPGKLSLREVVADVQDLHADASNAGALFQVASQFNLLEMISPDRTPEQGVGLYEYDRTQGPACAVAAGAGTIYRNYFVPVDGQIGQSEKRQIDCLADLGRALGNDNDRLWEMRNGYALATRNGLSEISQRLQTASKDEWDGLRKLLRIGVQWHTEVTLRDAGHLVSQAYGSALPVAFGRHPADLWEPFARLILEASYEAVMAAAVLNAAGTGNHTVFLTLLGGGAFGNRSAWIIASMRRALKLYENWELDVAIVSYGRSDERVQQLVR